MQKEENVIGCSEMLLIHCNKRKSLVCILSLEVIQEIANIVYGLFWSLFTIFLLVVYEEKIYDVVYDDIKTKTTQK